MNLALILTRFFTSGGMSLVQMVSVPPSFFLDAANAHLYRYSHFKTSRSIFTTRQFQKINFMPRLGHSMISTKLRCPHCILAKEFIVRIQKLLFGTLSVLFSLFGWTSSLILFALLTGLLFAHAVYSVHHLTNIYLLPLLHLHLIKLLSLHYDALLEFILVLLLHWFTLPFTHLQFYHHGTLRSHQPRTEHHRRDQEPTIG